MKIGLSRRVALTGLVAASGCALSLSPGSSAETAIPDNGIVRVKSAYNVEETVGRLKAGIAAKGIKFFGAVDQAQPAAGAGIVLHPSTLLIFGNPPLGTQFIAANPSAGLDWPVRLLVNEDANGFVWAVYSDFQWIANRHGLTDRAAQFKMASEVIASITSSIAAK